MARELAIVITADGSQARREFSAVDSMIKGMSASSVATGGTFDTVIKGMSASTGVFTASVHTATVTANELRDGLLLAFDHPIYAIRDLSKAVGVELVSDFSAGTLAAGALGVAIIGLGVKFVEHFVEMSESILDASYKMSDSVEHVAALKSAMDVAGGSIEQASNLLFMLQKRMEDGGPEAEKVALGLSHIGLSVQDLQGLSPVEYFLKIASAFQENTNQTNRATTAFDLFGRQGRDAIPLLMKPLAELTAEWAKNIDMTAADAQQAEALGMHYRGLKEEMSWMVSDIGEGIISFLVRLRHPTLDQRIGVDDLKLSMKGLHDIELESIDDTVLNTKQMKAFNDELQHNIKAEEEAAKAAQKLADAHQHLIDQAIEKHWAKVGDIVDRVFGADKLKAATEWTDAIATLGGTLEHLTAKELKDLEAAMLDAIDAMGRNGTLTDEQSSKYAALAIQAHQLAAAMGAVTTETQAWTAVENQVIVTGTAVSASIQSTAQSFAGLTVNIAATNEQMSAFYATLANASNVGTPGSDNIGVPSGGVGNLASAAAASVATLRKFPARAGGGPVSAGSPYMVGERGPELFTPGQSGAISPNGGGVGPISITIHGNVDSANSARALGDRVADQLMRRIAERQRITWSKS